jgi:hypothetical protein
VDGEELAVGGVGVRLGDRRRGVQQGADARAAVVEERVGGFAGNVALGVVGRFGLGDLTVAERVRPLGEDRTRVGVDDRLLEPTNPGTPALPDCHTRVRRLTRTYREPLACSDHQRAASVKSRPHSAPSPPNRDP